MGVFNVMFDSFFDGGDFVDQVVVVECGLEMLCNGVDVIDVGGELMWLGVDLVLFEEEMCCVIFVIKVL